MSVLLCFWSRRPRPTRQVHSGHLARLWSGAFISLCLFDSSSPHGSSSMLVRRVRLDRWAHPDHWACSNRQARPSCYLCPTRWARLSRVVHSARQARLAF